MTPNERDEAELRLKIIQAVTQSSCPHDKWQGRLAELLAFVHEGTDPLKRPKDGKP
jgi:hypothetical protein